MKKVIFLLVSIIVNFQLSIICNAQNLAPAPAQQQSILITGATVHVGNGTVIENGAVGFDKGKLTYVGTAPNTAQFSRTIDAKGKHVYPGIINCNSTTGLSEIGLVRSTRDFEEVGSLNPNVRALIAYNTDSKIIPTIRANGVLLTQIVPQGDIISGQSSVVMLDAWNWEDAAYKSEDGIHMNWPRMYTVRDAEDKEEKQREQMAKALDNIEQLFKEAQSYAKSSPSEINSRLESMKGLFDGSKRLYVHAGYVKQIEAAVAFAKKYGLKMVIIGGQDSWRVADLLKENHIPVILSRIHELPSREDDDYDLPYKLPYLLKQAGVEFALCMDNDGWQSRNLPFMAGTASEYGLTKEEALTSITLSPAKIIGVDNTAGSLEVGKDATLFVSIGDALDMRTNNVESAFINGRDINLDNVQKQLYHKYQQKYGLK